MCERSHKIVLDYENHREGPFSVIKAGAPKEQFRQARYESVAMTAELENLGEKCAVLDCCMRCQGNFFTKTNLQKTNS